MANGWICCNTTVNHEKSCENYVSPWISAEDRLPEDGVKGRYIVMVMSGVPYTARKYMDGIWFDYAGKRMQIVTHWMEPPELTPRPERK